MKASCLLVSSLVLLAVPDLALGQPNQVLEARPDLRVGLRPAAGITNDNAPLFRLTPADPVFVPPGTSAQRGAHYVEFHNPDLVRVWSAGHPDGEAYFSFGGGAHVRVVLGPIVTNRDYVLKISGRHLADGKLYINSPRCFVNFQPPPIKSTFPLTQGDAAPGSSEFQELRIVVSKPPGVPLNRCMFLLSQSEWIFRSAELYLPNEGSSETVQVAGTGAAVNVEAAAAAARPEPGALPAAEVSASDVITRVRPVPQTAFGYGCQLQRGPDRLKLMLRTEDYCGGDFVAKVVFHGDGEKNPFSKWNPKLKATYEELKKFEKAGYVISVTYVPGTFRVIEWTAAPPPVRPKRPEAAGVSAEVAVAVGAAARAAAVRAEPGALPAAEVSASDVIIRVRPVPQTAFGYICRFWQHKRDNLFLVLWSEVDCGAAADVRANARRGRLKARVVFQGDGRSGSWSNLELLERKLRALQMADYVVSVTYIHTEAGAYPSVETNRVIDWESAPPPATQDRSGAGDVITEIRPRPVDRW